MHALPTPPVGFLDAAGGQPLAAATLDAWRAGAQRGWADPGRLHHVGRESGVFLDAARAALARGLGVGAGDLRLAASGTAALQAGVQGALRPGGCLVHSAIESLAVFDLADRWQAAGGTARVIGVDSLGRIDLAALADALAPGDVSAVCVQAANAEIGTCQPLDAVHALTIAAGVPLIVDATGVVGHTPLPAGWDLLAADARDWAGPAGLGVLAVRPGTRWLAPYGSTRGWLGGVANVPAAVAAATALEAVLPFIDEQAAIHRSMIDQLRTAIAEQIREVDVVGDPVDRLPHVLTFSVLYARGEALVSALDQRGFQVASGSACVVDYERASHVLAAIGAFTGGNVRITLPYNCAQETIDGFLDALPEVVAAVREDI